VVEVPSSTAVVAITVGSYPSAVAIAPDGVWACVTTGGVVSVIDTASAAIVGNPIAAGGEFHRDHR
jgi:DNA-binding beta-propeller fold protein YncE